MTETNGFIEYGKRLEQLGKHFQNPKYKLQDLLSDCSALGLMISFRVESDPKNSANLTISNNEEYF